MSGSGGDNQTESTSASDMAILFADIGGSASLFQSEGDTDAHQLIVTSLAAMRDAIESCGGTLLRTVGDAVLARFDLCDQACAAAIAIQEQHIQSALAVRVGFHWGKAIADDGDVYGNAVNIAARVAEVANTGEIMATAEVVARMSGNTILPPLLFDELELKGISASISIYRIPWQNQDSAGATVVDTGAMAKEIRNTKTHLLCKIGDQSLVINERSEKCTIGRDTNNTIVATHVAASRLHASIECKQGVYVLEDLSTNGTYIIKDNQPPVYVHRDSITLDGAGVIATGFLPEKDSTSYKDQIEFVSRLGNNP